MEFANYLQFLLQLGEELAKATEIEQKKIQAVQAADLDAMNTCIRQEQAMSLTLRSMEQQRASYVRRLGLSDSAVRSLPEQCPPELLPEAKKTVETVLRQYQILKNTEDSARMLLECELHKVECRLTDAGVEAENLGDSAAQIPSQLRTDFRV